jgi:hypothetical protein
MREGICTSILRLNSAICCVTRSADGLLENAQRCQPENESIYSNEAPTEIRFKVKDFADDYEYDLTGNSAYDQLTFSIDGSTLSVVVAKQADIVNLAESIVKFIRTQQNLRPRVERELQYPLSRVTGPRTQQNRERHVGVRLNEL